MSTRSFSLRLTTAGVRSSSRLLLESEGGEREEGGERSREGEGGEREEGRDIIL